MWSVVVVKATLVALTCGRLSAFQPPQPYHRCPSGCPVSTHSPHQTEPLKYQTGNAACRLSYSDPSGPPSSGKWIHSHHEGKEKRHQEKPEGRFLGLSPKGKWGLWSHGGGSVCTGASVQSTPGEHQSLNSSLCDRKTWTYVQSCWGQKWITTEVQTEKNKLKVNFSLNN